MPNDASAEDEALKKLREIIEIAQRETEAEFGRTRNPWMLCYKSSVVGFSMALWGCRSVMRPWRYAILRARLNRLKVRMEVALNAYPTRTPRVPNYLKRDLFGRLDRVLPEESPRWKR